MAIPNVLRRRWVISSLVGVVLLVVLGYVVVLGPLQKCGDGLTATGSPYVCVGLDLKSTALRDADPLADLEHIIADDNHKVGTSEPFVTIVVLADMTPDPQNDIESIPTVRHDIEGAITAVSRANDDRKTGGIPKVRLLLANFSAQAGAWQQAVSAIEQARTSEHIVAVTGIGQSLDATRGAVAALSDAGIAVVGATVTADNMSFAPGPSEQTKRSKSFVRVAPTNTQEATAAANYIEQHGPTAPVAQPTQPDDAPQRYHQVLLVKDTNEQDSYARTLADAFETNVKVKVAGREKYESPNRPLNEATRAQLMTKKFADMHSDICTIRPDLIYFAGRGNDLGYFLTALSNSGACGLGTLDVLTGDSASDLVGQPVTLSGDLSFNVFYTALSYTNEWSSFPGSDYARNYQDFKEAFDGQQFKDAGLDDGRTMMSHDAVQVAVAATKADPAPTTDPDTVAGFFAELHCQGSVPGASGPIALDGDGNAIDKAMPILQLHADGTVTQKDLAWSTGRPFDPHTTC